MAQQRVEVKNPIGVNKSLDSADLPLNVWSNVMNVSFRNGKAKKAAGYQSVFGTPPSDILHLRSSIEAGVLYWYEATTEKIYKTDGTLHLDVTRLSGDYNATDDKGWTSADLNTLLVFNNPYDKPQCRLYGTDNFIDLPHWPTNFTCEVMRSYKNYLIALNTTEGGTQYPTTIRWSSPADPGQAPFTWNITDATNDAGENYLADTAGAIIDGKKLRDSFIIYKEDAVYSMNYIGGVYVFSFRQLFDDVGVLSKECVAEFDGKHFVVGQGDVYVHNGVQKSSVISSTMREYLFSNIKTEAYKRTFVVPDYSNTEMWICYCSNDNNDNTECDMALVWNWLENNWSIRQLPDIRHATFGIVDPQEPDWWDASIGVWDTDALPWGESNYNPSKLKIIMTSVANDKIYLVGNTTVFDDVSFTSTLERDGLSMSDDRGMKFVSSVTPHVTGEGTMQVYVGSQYIQGGPVTWKGPFAYDIGTQFKVDCRVTGRYIAIKFVTESLASWNLNGYTFEFEPVAGRR